MSAKRGRSKVIWTIVILAILAALFVRKGKELPPIEMVERGTAIEISEPVVSAFEGGEEIKFRVKYLGFIPIGAVTMRVKEISYLGKEVYHLLAEAKASSFFSFFCKYHSLFESYMDARNLYSLRFEEHTRSGRHVDERLTIYDQEEEMAETSEEGKRGSWKVRIGSNTQDFLSALYFLRGGELKEGEKMVINLNDRKRNYQVEIRILRREEIEIPSGKFAAWATEVRVMRVEKEKPGTTLALWLSDDERKLPLLIRAETKIGPMEVIVEGGEE